MELNYFKDVLFDLLNESDKLGVLNLKEDDRNNSLVVTMPDNSKILVECRVLA